MPSNHGLKETVCFHSGFNTIFKSQLEINLRKRANFIEENFKTNFTIVLWLLGEILWTQSKSCSWTFFSIHLASKRNGRGWILMSFWINEGEDGISRSRRLRAALKWWNSTLLFSWIAQKFTGKFTQMNNPSPANVNLTESVNSSFTKVYHVYCSKRLDTLKC